MSAAPIGAEVAGPRRIFLIGLPGSGKSTLGRALAAALGWPFLDLDDVIEAETGASIAALFASEGEIAFRRREAAALRRVAPAAPLVLATGGGTPCFHASMDWLLAHGHVVWLDVAPAVLAARLLAPASAPLAHRPLLATADPETASMTSLTARLTLTLAARRPFYARAPYRCTADCTTSELRALLNP